MNDELRNMNEELRNTNEELRITNEDWVECRLGDIANIYNGNSINARIKKEKYETCKIGLNYIGTKDVGFDSVINYQNGVKIPFNEPKFKIAPKGSVLVCSEGGSAGRKIGYTSEKVCFGNKLFAITNEYSVFEGKYVFYYTRYRGFFQSFKNMMNGIIGGVSAKKFSTIPIPLAPLPIQRAIVSKIETLFSALDNGIANLKKTQEQLKIYRQAVLKKAFEGELTKEWRQQRALSGAEVPTAEELLQQIKEEREKNYELQITNWKKAVKEWEKNGKEGKKPSKPQKPTNLDEKITIITEVASKLNIPNKWSLTTLAFVSDNKPNSIVDGPFGSSINVNEDYKETGVPVIRMVNIRPLKYVPNNLKFIVKEKFNQLRRHNILPDDILIAKVGATIGDCCIYPQNQPEGMLSTTGSCRIRLDRGIYSMSFLQYFILFQKYKLKGIASQTAQPFLNMKVLKAYPTIFLSLPEQHQIVQEIEKRLSVTDNLEFVIRNSLQKAEALRQSILKKAFEGKLLTEREIEQCKQEPDYEPASVLLKKIKAEKVKAQDIASQRKKTKK